MASVARRIAWVLSMLLLLVSGNGVLNFFQEWRDAQTMLQRSVQVSSLLYGIAGVVAAIGLLRRLRWTRGLAWVWGLSLTYAAGVAAYAYGDSIGGAFAGGIAAALLAAFVVWTVYRETGAATATTATTAPASGA